MLYIPAIASILNLTGGKAIMAPIISEEPSYGDNELKK
jgi:hypothetical protein